MKARAVKDSDTLSYHEAMASSHESNWMDASQKEILGLESKGTWEEVSTMSDARAKIIPGTWVFCIKRSPAGEIKKFKAQFCVRGDLEEEDDNNFAPVVAWSTVRVFLVVPCYYVLGWSSTISINFTNAFAQSILKTPVWIHLPCCFVSKLGPGTCLLRLRRSLYGLRGSPRLFYQTCIARFKKLPLVYTILI